MKIIIPMAGRGTRLRPHTLTVPKPLLPIAGKPIVERLAEDLAASCGGDVDEIAFIIGDFGAEVEKELLATAHRLGAKGSIYYQNEQLGTAHAIHCAAKSLTGPVIVAFADTLFKADFKLDTSKDGVIWVKKVANPSAYGVVKLDSDGIITELIEKPKDFVSDLAIIGIYYFHDGEYLLSEIQYLLDNDIREKGEYQITNALENMKRKGAKFAAATIEEWLDFGSKELVIESHAKVLDFNSHLSLRAATAVVENSVIIEPCYLGEGVKVTNSVIGPHVSLGANSTVNGCVISNSIIQHHAHLSNAVIANSMLGNHVRYHLKREELSLGDYSAKTEQ